MVETAQKTPPGQGTISRWPFMDYPGGTLPAQPAVSLVIPLYNEVAYVRPLVEAVLAQDYPALAEIWLVDGQSTDGTWEALQQLQSRDSRLKVLRNPRRIQAAGLNLAFAQARGDVLMRLDAHADYAGDVVSASIRTLLKTGAGGVGAIARPLAPDTLIGQSIAAAHQSRLGVGVARFRQASAEGWTDTVWNGCYWKYIVDRVGPLREDLPRLEDNDFNARVRALGYGLYLSPEIRAYYRPRSTLGELGRQYAANGYGVGWALLRDRSCLSWRHLAPLALVAGLALSLLAAALWPPALFVAAAIALLYLPALALFSALAWRKRQGGYALLLPVVFATLHGSYGLGTLHGLIESLFTGAAPRRAKQSAPEADRPY